MHLIAWILTGIVALEHLYIAWFEMFAWETTGKRVFKGSLPDHMFAPTRKLAANQGLYNAFLVAGLVWAFLIDDPVWQKNVVIFFLSCVIVAGVYGGLTASRKIIFVQALPAVLALLATLYL